MINWGEGYFLGLKIGFIFIILAIEFYFLVFDRWMEKDITLQETIIFSLLFIVSIIITVFKMSLVAIFIPFSGYLFINILQKKKEDIITQEMEIKRVEELKKIISQQPNNYKAYMELGDLFFKKEEYATALDFYKTAYKIKDLPEVKQKIIWTEKEDKIKKGIIWICRNCGETNKGEESRCKNCGNEKDVIKSIKNDLKTTKKYLILLFLSPFLVLLMILIIKKLPLYFSLVLFLLLLYLILRYFLLNG
ncbi:MAG: hypothetical protein N2589_04825 [bacterium]|nr:hypothetical protein [bacterium]